VSTVSMLFATTEIAAFCKRWKIRELALFGSALRDEFRPDSDLDILVTFTPDADWSLLDHIQMQLELEKLFGRSVDLISKRALERSPNRIRREEILKTAHIVYSEETPDATR
jgi:predicted nucleotidyltransferase